MKKENIFKYKKYKKVEIIYQNIIFGVEGWTMSHSREVDTHTTMFG